MEEFLKQAKDACTHLDDFTCIHLVIGNESCDLDSAVSALAYAFYLFKSKPDFSTNDLYLPVLNIPRSQYRLRTEITYFLGHNGIPPDLLIFRDDLDLGSLAPRLSLTLVDHHVLQGELSSLDQQVVKVIDHRPLEKQWNERVACSIELVGSCSTLVYEEIAKQDHVEVPAQVAMLLLGTILTDTINLSPSAGKTTPKDEAAVDKLKQSLPDVNTQTLYDNIHHAKSDLSGLSSREILEKDLKVIHGASLSIAMCSIMMQIKDVLAREDLITVLEVFVEDKNVNVVVVMTLWMDAAEPRRELAVYSSNRIYRQQIADVLDTCSDPSLQLEPTATCDNFIVFNQGNVQASRKKVMPVLRGFLTGEKTPDDYNSENIEQLVPETRQGGSLVDQGTSSHSGDIVVADSPDTIDQESPPISDSTTSSDGTQLTSPGRHLAWQDESSLGNVCSDRQAEGSDLSDSNDRDSNLNALDVFSSPSHASNNADFSGNTNIRTDQVCDFIDNLINTQTDDLELSDEVMLYPSPGQDLLTPQLDSPMDMSSEQNSGQGSKVSSYPVTPPNSFIDSNFAAFAQDHDLPSFNSSEMMEKIKAKKASLTGSDFLTDFQQDEMDDVTFTPQNSYAESNTDKYFKETQLPSFHNSEMVQRIREKRASLENAVCDVEDEADGVEDTFPWTPHNSYVETSLDGFRQENLPSFNNAEMVRRIQEKRQSLPSLDENENEAAANVIDMGALNSVPFTPQNSCLDGEEGSGHGQVTDMEQVVGKLVGSRSGEGQCYVDDLLDLTGSDNCVVNQLAADMLHDGSAASENELLVSDNVVALNMAEEMVQNCLTLNGPHDGQGYSSKNCDGNDHCQAVDTSQDIKLKESVVSEIAYALASELIEEALETFSVQLAQSAEVSDNVNQTIEEKVNHMPESHGATETETPSAANRSYLNSMSVETEYLPEMDPFHGSVDMVGNTIETDAGKEVVEGASFRKFSGQESPSAHEEIVETLHDAVKHESVESTKSGRKVIHIGSDLSQLAEVEVEADADKSESNSSELGDPRALRHHISMTADERKEVYMTSAGRISIGVDQEAELSNSPSDVRQGRMQVGSVTDEVFSSIAETAEDDETSDSPACASDSQTACNSDPACQHDPPTHPLPSDPVSRTISSSSSSSKERVKGVELKDEWQDDGFPGMLKEENASRPQTLGASSDGRTKKKIVPAAGSFMSDEDPQEKVDELESPYDLDSPDDLEDGDLGDLEWENDTPVLSPEPIPEYTEQEEKDDARRWKTVTLGQKQFRIDLRVIEPYKKVLSHGGYYGDGLNAIILFCGCYLPDRRRKDYNYVMDNLFYYVVHTLEQLVAEDYMIVYFHGATPRKQMPSLSWLKKCYQMIDRRLRKNLKALLLVHPTLWLKTVVMMTRPFISTKFSSKLRFVKTLRELAQLLPMDHVYVPDLVKSYDDNLGSRPNQSIPSTPTSHPASR